MDYNADTSCLGTKFIVMDMKERTYYVYPYDISYEPMYIVPIVTIASTYTDINTWRFFILLQMRHCIMVRNLAIL